MRATADLQTPEEFENLILGDNVRLGDIATVTLGPDIGTSSLRSDGRQGIGLGIIRQAQSNTLDISEGVKKAVATIAEILPEGTQLEVTSDDAVFIDGAIHEVEIALVASVIIVTIVIYLFLLDWRATLIPTLTMPIALIGTCAAIYLAGFSINILTLLAIVLATGLVVDDAIVVLENIVRRRGEGMGPRAAAVLGTLEVFFAVIATTATLAAVFVPLSFLPGQTGGLFREFGFVLAFAILLSAFVSLTLCPMLASRMLKPHGEEHGHTGLHGQDRRRFAAGFYRRTLRACLNAPLIVFMVAVMVTAAGAGAFTLLKSELTPTEDRAPHHAADAGAAGRFARIYAGADAPRRGRAEAAGRQRRDRQYLLHFRPGRLGQQRLHGADAGALGRPRAYPAADFRRHHQDDDEYPVDPGLPDPAEQPRHPRRRQWAAGGAGRQRLR